MLVTFISQCEKKAINRTRRILDAFANRIGDNVWQTAITEDGLTTVKKLLRQSATKSTAVSCHRVRTRQRTELVWIVGNRNKFNEVGIVPVNWTEKEMDIYQDNHSWKTLSMIKGATIISALFHDIGKATKLFQDKINPDIKSEKNYEPYRHEWISLRIFEAFVYSCPQGEVANDKEWITRLADGDFDKIKPTIRDDKTSYNKNPLKDLPPFAQIVGWLILSHHKLPLFPSWKEEFKGQQPPFSEIEHWFDSKMSALWNSAQCESDEEKQRLDSNWHFLALPYQSKKWSAHAITQISELKDTILTHLNETQNILHDDLFSSHIARLALMMADHYVSALCFNDSENLLGKYKDKHYSIYANTDWLEDGSKAYKQQLDQHLIGVAIEAEKICRKLPIFQKSLPSLSQNSLLEQLISKKEITQYPILENFIWQNACIKTAELVAKNTLQYGFFGINMASTGLGKTRANAKIMYTLGSETGSIRFNVALGLRTLTLQTGREFQTDLKIDKKDISIAVGGISVKELFEKNEQMESATLHDNGSQSSEDMLNSEYNTEYETTYIQEHPLYTWTTKSNNKEKHRINKLIQPPILVCTIDHLIPATEGIRGGQQIAPMLRLLTSDLILDEPDDFGLNDLPALCRLVHWTGLLGRRVLLSTATMPPPLVYACFEAYKHGWSHYAKANLSDWDNIIQCAWFDEFNTDENILNDFADFKINHGKFVNKRISELEKQSAKRKGKIVKIHEDDRQTAYRNMADTIFNSINELHHNHHVSQDNKNISIGLVRMANIDPMIAVAKHLLAKDAPDNTQIHYCVYHSRYPLAVRSHIEEKLDYILKRKDKERLWETNKGIADIVSNTSVQNHIFVVLASPVAEVGRDHDYDWAVIEPSSMRSIIQIAGRVLRHRHIYPTTENIHLLNKNIKGLQGKSFCFEKPGFESKDLKTLLNHVNGQGLEAWLKENEIAHINANPKITPLQSVQKFNNQYQFLSELEYIAIQQKLRGQYKNETCKENDKNKFVKSAKPWWQEKIHWSGELQKQQKFRKSEKDITLIRYLESELDKFEWKEKKEDKYDAELEELRSFNIDYCNEVLLGKGTNFWYEINEEEIYAELLQAFKKYGSLDSISNHFGKVIVPIYNRKPDIIQDLEYHPQLGLYRVKGEQ